MSVSDVVKAKVVFGGAADLGLSINIWQKKKPVVKENTSIVPNIFGIFSGKWVSAGKLMWPVSSLNMTTQSTFVWHFFRPRCHRRRDASRSRLNRPLRTTLSTMNPNPDGFTLFIATAVVFLLAFLWGRIRKQPISLDKAERMLIFAIFIGAIILAVYFVAFEGK